MKYYQNVERPILGPVDLSVLQNTYNTLEQGHIKGVELASKLRTAIAELPLNESEEEYKDELASGIEQVINDNAFNGNAYYAIPELIKAQGDISSNPILRNKIQAQADYKAYQDNIDANRELTGDMKEYYKELNPYRSGQKEDGSYDTTFKWTPNATPKAVVDLNKMVTQGIARAARESGSGTVTRWLDENGNITTDPSKAYDGEIFNTTTGAWERLTREKILAGIQSVILETPGAQESLKQDYDVALWKLSKQPTTDTQGNPIVPVSDVTDPNGIPLTETEYLMKRIAPAVEAAQYNNNANKTIYGQGLATYKAPKVNELASALAGAGSLSSTGLEDLTSVGRGIILSVPTNPGGDAVNNMNAVKNEIANTYKNLTDKDINPQSYEDLSSVVDEMKSVLNPMQQTQFGNMLRMYKSAEDTLNAYTKDMTDNDRKEWDWANRMLNGGQLINGATKHDDKILNSLKDKYDNNGNLTVKVSKETLNKFREFITNPSEYRLTIGNNTITINKDNQNYIPQIFSYITKAYDETALAGGNRDYNAAYNIQQSKPEIINPNSKNRRWFVNNDTASIRKISNEYNKAQSIIDKYSSRYNVNPKNIDVDVTMLDGQTWNANYIENQYKLGLIDRTTANDQIKKYNENIARIIAGGDINQYQIYKQEKDKKGHIVQNPQDKVNISNEINSAYKDNRIEYVPAFAPGAVDPLKNELGGYYITIYNDESKKDVQNKYYIPGLGGETARTLVMTDPQSIASNKLSVIAQTGSSEYLSVVEQNPILSNVKIEPLSNIAGLETYNISIWDDTIPMTKDDATKFTVAIEQYQQIKNYYQAGGEVNERMQNALSSICNTIAKTTGYSIESVAIQLGNDIEE